MKKLSMVISAVVVAFAANAATFRWSANSIYSPVDSTALYNGSASLFCDAIGTDALSTVSVVDGTIASTTFNDSAFATKFETGTTYGFYFVIEDTIDGICWTYAASKSAKAQASSSPSISFGNQSTMSTTGGGWTSSATPEPTSGLLLLLGMASLALKRKGA